MWWYTYTEGLCIAGMYVLPMLMDPVLENPPADVAPKYEPWAMVVMP